MVVNKKKSVRDITYVMKSKAKMTDGNDFSGSPAQVGVRLTQFTVSLSLFPVAYLKSFHGIIMLFFVLNLSVTSHWIFP